MRTSAGWTHIKGLIERLGVQAVYVLAPTETTKFTTDRPNQPNVKIDPFCLHFCRQEPQGWPDRMVSPRGKDGHVIHATRSLICEHRLHIHTTSLKPQATRSTSPLRKALTPQWTRGASKCSRTTRAYNSSKTRK